MSDSEKQEIEYEDEDETGEAADLVVKIKKLKEKLAHCNKEKQEYLTGWQRCQADFINYRRRQEEQMAEWLKLSGERVIMDILAVVDTLDAAEKNTSPQPSPSKGEGANPPAPLSKGGEGGLKAVKEQLMKILKAHGLEEIKSIGEKFNPLYHEAVEQVEGESEPGMIVEEIQKGYMLNGKVIRGAKVKVTKIN